jgi:hypothetical protein
MHQLNRCQCSDEAKHREAQQEVGRVKKTQHGHLKLQDVAKTPDTSYLSDHMLVAAILFYLIIFLIRTRA